MTQRAYPRHGLAFLLALMALSVALTALTSARRLDQGRWVAHTVRVLAQIESARAAQAEVRHRERNVVLGGRAEDRRGHASALGAAGADLDELARLTADNPVQRANIGRLRATWGAFARASEAVVASRGSLRERIALTMGGEHLLRFELAGAVLGAMRAEEERLLPLREAALQRSCALFNGAFVGTTLVMALSLLLLARSLRSQEGAQREADAALAEEGAALQAANDRLRGLAEAAFEGISVSQDGAIVDANSAFLGAFGYGITEARGMAAELFVAPESRERVLRKRAAQDEEPYEALLLRRDGTTFHAEVRGRGIELGGRPARVTAVRDLTERREAERALRESRAFAQAVADNPTGIVYVFDLETMSNVYANRRAGEFLGLDEEALRSAGAEIVRMIVHPEDLPSVLEHLAALAHAADGDVLEYEARFQRHDGEWRRMAVREVAFERRADGSVRQLLGAVQDVTERRALEAEVAARRDELARANARLLDNQALLDERLAEVAEMNVELEAQRYQLRAVNGRLAALADTDGLTGLTNQRAFRERLAVAFSEGGRGARGLSVVALDVDRFKAYNDAFGHLAGDAALRAVAEALRDLAHEGFVPARNGGEEFAILLPGAGESEAAALAERVRAAVEGSAWPLRPVTVSLGVATLGEGHGSPEELLEAADRALYAAKEGGRNRVTIARPLAPAR